MHIVIPRATIKQITKKKKTSIKMNNKREKKKTNSKVAGIISTIAIITLSVNILNTPIKRQRLLD